MADFDLPEPLTPAELQTVNDCFATLDTLLGRYDISLAPTQAAHLQKMADKSIPFAQDGLEAAQNNGGSLPADFDVAAYAKAFALFTQMSAIELRLKQLVKGVGNTGTIAGSQTMGFANALYGYLKTGARKSAALKAVVDVLAQRYKQSRAKATPTNTP